MLMFHFFFDFVLVVLGPGVLGLGRGGPDYRFPLLFIFWDALGPEL